MWAGSSVSAHANLPLLSVSTANAANFGAYVRHVYREHFAQELAAGSVKPLIIPYSVLGSFILPVLYFSIPHVNRPWLFRARYLLMLFILVFNLSETLSSSSPNFAIGYAVGLMQAWGILWSATLLVWMSPQFEAERVEKRKRVGGAGASTARSGSAKGHAEDGLAVQNGHPLAGPDGPVEASKQQQHHQGGEMSQATDAPDEDIARSLKEGYEYYWQAYPVDAPLRTRLDWSADLVLSFRGTGWNWCVPVLPRFAKPEKPLCGSPVDLNSIPLCTRQGYRRYTTNREWLRVKLVPMVLSYLALDLLSVLMMKDPYFILGPEFASVPALAPATPLSLPPFLARLPPPLLFLYRSLVCGAAILIALDLIMTGYQLLAHFALGRLLGTRSELWHYPSVYGGFVHGVLDRGLAGFWGAWWHQTFRTAFGAPGAWLARRGHLGDPRARRARALAGLLAFAQSGFLHALGSVSCLPPSRPWAPPLFFLLCWAGALGQQAAAAAVAGRAVPGLGRGGTPVWLRRAGNFAVVFAWLNCAQPFLSDDMGRAGIWLIEPVPVSLWRAVGLGKPGDSWWRWDWELWPRWWVGRTWWQSGIAL